MTQGTGASARLSHVPLATTQPPRPRVLSVIGARPEIIQAAAVSAALADVAEEILVHTGQHYDPALSERQIHATRLPEPHHNLGVGSGTREEQLLVGCDRLVDIIDLEQPDVVLVRGDTNATLAGARAAMRRELPLVHVEAGLRSYRDDMPEEANRVETDRLADLLCAPVRAACDTLRREGVSGDVQLTGDPLCDVLLSWADRVRPASGDYVLATVHRNYNTDDAERLEQVLRCLDQSPWPVVLPAHPRLTSRLRSARIEVPKRVRLVDPVTYPRMLELERGARCIATDSGGVQREAYLWGVPCITLREETEWTDTVTTGWNTLVGADPQRFADALRRRPPRERPRLFGDGRSAQRIAAHTVALATDVAQVS
jgi:UDP-N-acetylglucosamine 2-epimerase